MIVWCAGESVNKPYRLGTWPKSWQVGKTWNVTLIVTEDCNLRCSYCYLCGKNRAHRMSLDTAIRGLELFLSQSDHHDSIILEFIGGEPFLEIDLLNEITEYWKFALLERRHKWLGNFRISISTNGILYDDERVQRWIRKNYELLSIGITIDGTKEKHDSTRVYPDGRGSYDDVARNVPLWVEQYPNASTKATFSPACIPSLCDSILNIWNLGIKEVAANVVFEDVWTESDVESYKAQLCVLADIIVQEGLWKEYNCTFFSDTIGRPQDPMENQNWCGAGKMMAVGTDGTLYPCLRFAQYSLANQPARTVGTLDTGIDLDRVRAFHSLTRYSQSPDECLECEVATGCAWCQGCNYDCAGTTTVFQRSLGLCEMHKARVAANEYYWRRLEEATGIRKVSGR